ncbi:MAG: hypothetical protein ACRESL_23220, partial [Pseudomonas sp.]
HDRDLAVRLKEQQLTAALFQLPVLRDNLRVTLQSLDESLAWLGENGRGQPECGPTQTEAD